MTLVRCPENYKKCFYQKHLSDVTNSALHLVPITSNKNHVTEYIYIDDKEGLLTLIQMGVLEIHPWGSRIDNLEYPDRIIFDLDPDPTLPWKNVVQAALEIKQYLEELHLQSFVKTTDGKGLHVVVPIKPEYPWSEIKNFTHTLVKFLENTHPDKYVSNMAMEKRKGKIFVDYLRNQSGATAIAAYALRARIHTPVSVPLHWDELTNNIRDTFFTIFTLQKRLGTLKNDPWKEFFRTKQSITP